MFTSKLARKWSAVVLILCMIFSLAPPWEVPKAYAASDCAGIHEGDVETTFGAQHVKFGNCTYEADNALANFYNNITPGFSYNDSGKTHNLFDGDVFVNAGDTVTFNLNVADNDDLKNLAKSGHATVQIGWKSLNWNETSGGCGFLSLENCFQGTNAKVWLDGDLLHEAEHYDGGDGGPNGGGVWNSELTPLNANTTIKIQVHGIRDDIDPPTGARGLYVKFRDEGRPEVKDYTFDGDGVKRTNKNSNEEVYAKKGESFSLAYNFSEPVRPTLESLSAAAIRDPFLKHPFFINLPGTLLPGAGQQQYLENESYKNANFSNLMNSPLQLLNSIKFKYTAVKYHQSGLIPLAPAIVRTDTEKANTSSTKDDFTIDSSLEQKLRGARLADAAGNVVRDYSKFTTVSGVDNKDNNYLRGKQEENPSIQMQGPFDYDHGGFRGFVDAVRPKYTKTGNGIQPEILTGSTLNTNDGFDFTVQLTEEAIVKTGWDVTKTFLLLNNGMRAYYVSGDQTDKWTFHLSIPDVKGLNVETPLLKAIALTNDANVNDPATGNSKDTNVLQDYAGNMLVQPSNYEGEFVVPEDIPEYPGCNRSDPNSQCPESSLVNSKIDWAQLAIDNTKPIISYRYETGGATDAVYKQSGKITIDANDPTITVPSLDPLVPGEVKPSRGIYRPSNMTGSSSPAVGLVYYMWSQSQNDPFASNSQDQFAAVKRYSLTGKQPREDLYPTGFEKINLSVANNKTNLIVLPTEALEEGKSGEWYLHTWTSDMTWDTARELMQYAKKKAYVEDNQAQYEAWKAEAPGSEADKIFYADNKALAEVGKYELWPLGDFKHDDSNWVHSVGTIKVDNKAPTVTAAEPIGNNTSAVQLPVTITDEHSGVQDSQYQWVKVGTEPQGMWQPVTLVGNSATLTTQNEVVEDGNYVLMIKTTDVAGNVRNFQSNSVTVNSSSLVNGAFLTATSVDSSNNPVYVKSSDVEFKLVGVDSITPMGLMSVTQSTYSPTVTQSTYTQSVTQSTYGGMMLMSLTDPDSVYVGYVLSGSALRPADAAFQSFTDYTLKDGGRVYVVPADVSKNGTLYVHIVAKVTEGGFTKQYFFSKAYYFDNQPPTVTFSKDGVAYPQASQSVTVTVDEPYSQLGLQKKYQWVVDGQSDPNEASAGWVDLPEDGKTAINGETLLQPGEQKNFWLYVWAKDGAGNNVIVKTKSFFALSRSEDAGNPPAEVTSDLIYLYGDTEDGYTAIVQLGLAQDSVDKGGYDFSLSPDNGVNWVRWRPYTNFVALKVPTNKPSELQVQVKYRTLSGVVGAAKGLSAANISKDEPIYALASISNERPVNPSVGADIDVTVPLGMKVTPAAVNPSTPTRSGNRFNVKQNGLYAFDVTDTADANRKATLYAVVKNVDDTKPIGSIEYLTTGKTNGNVTVQLSDLSEPVTVTNNEGRTTYKFTQNGSFTFEIKDEAGNANSITANVNNIDKAAPQVKIVRSYAYGENNSQTFGTIKDGSDHVLLSGGVTLMVEKADVNAKDFTVADGQTSILLLENGTASFMVSDLFGNTAVVKETVDNIVSTLPQVSSITYSFVDDDGNPLPDSKIVTVNGQKYAQGKMKVTLSGQIQTPNMVFAGTTPTKDKDTGQYTNQISGLDGSFTYSRMYSADGSTLIALTDLLGNTNKVAVAIKGLDNTPPDIKLNLSSVGISQNKADFNFRTDLGGYSVSDNVSNTDQIAVAISGLDLSKLGRQRVTYTATDQVGNTAVAYQDVTVVASDGMLIFADNVLISGSSNESALFNSNTLTFSITKYNVMEVGGQNRINEWGTYDLLYQPGLYREGQMKYIATKLSYSDLVNGKFKITFPDTGWYTIIVRNQEREREYSTFFIGKKD
ncbi:hypothetical protein [Paenibacillus thalictri]|uniref:DUF5011 domain-containing protein n=1 Tax=Paenibacillus thalictri TaxID=2527873 RepID=A0A4Q9DM28_9BACL|nr:hypothetical protein [Paenibacillus thalictri]TBL76272.1 hypothetical protein EYB31_19940 [Paenibacillus thalictri]